MSFLIGLIVGSLASYLIVTYFAELKLRLEILENSLGLNKEQGYKWLNTKNPGIKLKKPSELKLMQFISFVEEIKG